MDGIESMGMPPMWPPVESTDPVAYDALVHARRTAVPENGLRVTNDATVPVEGSDDKKKQIARDFESVLLTKLFDEVQRSIGNWGLGDEDGTSQQVHGLFWLYLARDVADKGGVGLWKDIYQNLKQMEDTGGLMASFDEEF